MDVLTYKYDTLVQKLQEMNKDDVLKQMIIDETQ